MKHSGLFSKVICVVTLMSFLMNAVACSEPVRRVAVEQEKSVRYALAPEQMTKKEPPKRIQALVAQREALNEIFDSAYATVANELAAGKKSIQQINAEIQKKIGAKIDAYRKTPGRKITYTVLADRIAAVVSEKDPKKLDYMIIPFKMGRQYYAFIVKDASAVPEKKTRDLLARMPEVMDYSQADKSIAVQIRSVPVTDAAFASWVNAEIVKIETDPAIPAEIKTSRVTILRYLLPSIVTIAMLFCLQGCLLDHKEAQMVIRPPDNVGTETPTLPLAKRIAAYLLDADPQLAPLQPIVVEENMLTVPAPGGDIVVFSVMLKDNQTRRLGVYAPAAKPAAWLVPVDYEKLGLGVVAGPYGFQPVKSVQIPGKGQYVYIRRNTPGGGQHFVLAIPEGAVGKETVNLVDARQGYYGFDARVGQLGAIKTKLTAEQLAAIVAQKSNIVDDELNSFSLGRFYELSDGRYPFVMFHVAYTVPNLGFGVYDSLRDEITWYYRTGRYHSLDMSALSNDQNVVFLTDTFNDYNYPTTWYIAANILTGEVKQEVYKRGMIFDPADGQLKIVAPVMPTPNMLTPLQGAAKDALAEKIQKSGLFKSDISGVEGVRINNIYQSGGMSIIDFTPQDGNLTVGIYDSAHGVLKLFVHPYAGKADRCEISKDGRYVSFRSYSESNGYAFAVFDLADGKNVALHFNYSVNYDRLVPYPTRNEWDMVFDADRGRLMYFNDKTKVYDHLDYAGFLSREPSLTLTFSADMKIAGRAEAIPEKPKGMAVTADVALIAKMGAVNDEVEKMLTPETLKSFIKAEKLPAGMTLEKLVEDLKAALKKVRDEFYLGFNVGSRLIAHADPARGVIEFGRDMVSRSDPQRVARVKLHELLHHVLGDADHRIISEEKELRDELLTDKMTLSAEADALNAAIAESSANLDEALAKKGVALDKKLSEDGVSGLSQIAKKYENAQPNKEKPAVVFVTVEPENNLIGLKEALEKLRKENRQVKIILVGREEYEWTKDLRKKMKGGYEVEFVTKEKFDDKLKSIKHIDLAAVELASELTKMKVDAVDIAWIASVEDAFQVASGFKQIPVIRPKEKAADKLCAIAMQIDLAELMIMAHRISGADLTSMTFTQLAGYLGRDMQKDFLAALEVLGISTGENVAQALMKIPPTTTVRGKVANDLISLRSSLVAA